MTRAVLRVTAAGPLCSVQDGGRAGFLRFGVPASGAMDRAALALANHGLGNPPGAAAVEVSLGGLTLEVEEGALSIAIAGGGFLLDRGSTRLGSWQVVTLREGDRLAVRRGPWGAWSVMAFAGRLIAPDWLGSRATHALSGLGGGAVTKGQRLVVEDSRLLPERPIACPVWARPRGEVAVVIGPQDRFFGSDRIDLLLGTTFHLTDAYDRMGVRLRGPSLAPQSALAIPSEPVLRGSIQVAGDGVPVVLLADHQTTGGYPKIATLVGSELDGFAQLRPHAAVAFRAVSPEQAVGMARLRAAALARLLER
ncbi:allophanate hydrolase [Tabrizicola sp. TH137]|uniref:5-oxoprolinase subunit C family protein n=1 Tax=Tabrizicola sp. TH137 TaxID=2067452 RepID=UPI000C7D995C|nr:biotin-dependent carboxyltransferase family protein [Tabrizicola sp. TH137]PLL11390.1 allophanate hydrolase [Tabrizicola sp. TH137]